MISPIDQYAIWQIQHFLVGIVAYIILRSIIGKHSWSMGGVLAWSTLWELYENLWMIEPIDTIWDVMLSLIGASMVDYWIRIMDCGKLFEA